MNEKRLDKMQKRINSETGKPFKHSGYTQFAGAINDTPAIILPNIMEVVAKRLVSFDGKFPSNYVKTIGQVVKVRLSSQMFYDVVNPLNEQEERRITIDIVNENGKVIGWELAEIFFDRGINQ